MKIIISESQLAKVIEKMTKNNQENIAEEVDKTDKCYSMVNPIVKKHVELLKMATNNFTRSSNWDEKTISEVYLSIKSKEQFNYLDKALGCYLNHKLYSPSIFLLFMTFQDYEVSQARPVLVYLSYKLGLMDKVQELFDVDKFKLV